MRAPFVFLSLLSFSLAGFSQEDQQGKVPPWFTLEVGDAWTFVDTTGSVTIEVMEQIEVEEEAAYKVGWFSDEAETPYQIEFWRKKGAEYFALGREIGGRVLMFDEPYVFLREAMAPGDSWVATLKVMGREMKLTFTVGERERVETGIGSFEAIKVSVNGPGQSIDRWYSPAIGMVKEIGRISLGGRTSPGNEKILKRRVEGTR